MIIKNNMKQKNSGRKNAVSQLELDNKIAKVIYDKWPRIVTQKEIAEELNVSQSLVSKRLSGWEKKRNAPLKMVYEERNSALEEGIRSAYNLDDVVVFKNPDYFVYTKTYFNQIGKLASDVLVKKINAILEKKSEAVDNKIKETGEMNKTEIKISASGGNSVFSTTMSLVDELENTDIKLIFSGCVALRSSSLIELTPLHIVSQLLHRKLSVEVAHTYQLPEISNLYNKESLFDIVNQRIRTQKMLEFNNRVLQSDIVIFGLGTIRWNFPMTGFMRHIYNLRLQSFIKNFDILGEIAFAPFNKNGFLFHHLVTQVFEQKDGEFLHDEYEQIELLKKFAPNNVTVTKHDLIDAATFFSSIFTVNFCDIEKSVQKRDKKPYILLVVGGESQKALPLKIMLEKWKHLNLIDGLVTGENIAQNL
ncbi:MAG TPA: hypothetical protein ACFYDZ_06965 [Candidatus Brocadiaceae bacterium]